jgi:tetratricopeptide (TPR) repeat protein
MMTTILLAGSLLLAPPSTLKLKTLLNSLSRDSISEQLAFYELYPNTPEGQQALTQAFALLGNPHTNLAVGSSLIQLINKQPYEEVTEIPEEHLTAIEQFSNHLGNRKLKGHSANSEEEVLALNSEEIDLARGLFLSQLGTTPKALHQIRIYESIIDLMALQIYASLGNRPATPEQKISAINTFIFEKLGFRFPPHSRYAKDIDLYTFLPSVLDSRRGVCLGVSTLYMCIAQRLDLKLEMITPPGHIYVRYRDGDKIINIETTARGINLDSDVYLGINTRSLKQRNVKEVIGTTHFNQASTYWLKEEYEKALAAYHIAEKYMGNDFLVKELMAYNYILSGNETEGRKLLELVRHHLPDDLVYKETMADDILDGYADKDAIKYVFIEVDETRESIERKKDKLEEMVNAHPKFRSGLFQLATAWLQLHRDGEALEVLKRYHELDPNNPTAEYYLAVLYGERLDYNQAWKHLNHAEKLLQARNHESKILKKLHKELSLCCPETLHTLGGKS